MTDPPRRPTLRQIQDWVVASWKAIVGVAGGLAVILGLVFHPPWRGDSSSGASGNKATGQGCPGISKGRISKVTADKSVRLGAYWKMNPGSPATVRKERLNAIGRVVHFRVDINGYKGKQLTVWWWMLTANGEPVSEPTLQRQLAFALTPHDCSTGGTRDIWAELPKRPGTFQVEVQLIDPAGEKLDFGRTKPFAVRATQS